MLARALGRFLVGGRGASTHARELGTTRILGTTNLLVELWAADTAAGVVLFDTGLDPRARPIARLLRALGRQPDDVRELFLTHAHPDHVAGAAAYPAARVWIGAAEAGRLRQSETPYKLAEAPFPRVFKTPAVEPDELLEGVRELELGGERLVALPMPGDTLGAYAYHFRGALFVGDALEFHAGRLSPAPAFGADDPAENLRSSAGLLTRLDALGLELVHVCTCHGGATPAGEARALLESIV